MLYVNDPFIIYNMVAGEEINMDYISVQHLNLADCRTFEAQLHEMKLNYPKWQMPAYPESVQSFVSFRTAMEFKVLRS